MAKPSHEDGEIPVRGWNGPHPIPDLSKIPRERWEEVLRKAHASVRERASLTLEDPARIVEANTLGWRIDAEEHARRKAARKVVASLAPLPGADVPKRTRYKQVNFRLTRQQYLD